MKRKSVPILLLSFFVPCLVFSSSFAEELCVDPTDPGCYHSINSAISASVTDDIILVSHGTYSGFSCNINLTIKGENPTTTVISSTTNGVHVSGNTLNLSGFYITGGHSGVLVDSSAALNISNCIIAGCGMSGIYFNNCDSRESSVINNTTAFNGSNGIYFYDPDGPTHTVFNNISAYNAEYGIKSQTSGTGHTKPLCEYNDLYGNISGSMSGPSVGTGTIYHNPLFIDQDVGDFRIQSTSLCINAGNPSQTYLDPDGTRNDMGAYGGSGASSFCQYPDCGPVTISVSVSPASVPQGSSITIQATGEVRE